MDKINVTNQSSIEAAKEKYKKWSAGMKEKYADSQDVYLLLGKESFPLTSDHRFTNPISYQGHSFYRVEVAYKFAKYFAEDRLEEPYYSKFYEKCLDSNTTGETIRGLERALRNQLMPIPQWLGEGEYNQIVMKDLNLQKFEQNPDLLDILLATGQREIIAPSFEVSGSGAIWGDRVYETQFDQNYNQIGGKNIHGKILTEIREELKK
jgi:predicted NAD-dependent protein-ADP-ribosyltransferase YbiA (DUF1768 family)